jgi:hypothetical protein
MLEAAARNLRTAERFLLSPPLLGSFGDMKVAICDISARGARFRHEARLETGQKGVLKLPYEGDAKPLLLEAVVVWVETDASTGKYMSGVRTYSSPEVMNGFIEQLQTSQRTNRIEELRSADRFVVNPSIEASFDGHPVHIENLSARGARIETTQHFDRAKAALLAFRIPDATHEVVVTGQVMWTAVKAISNAAAKTYRSGLLVAQKPELMRLAIAQLCELNRATLDTQSLALKLKVMRARARQFAPSFKSIEASGLPAEQFLLIQGVREELRLNPDEAMHWYRRARLVINDPVVRTSAPMICDYPDALAVWEYLDRSVDPTIVSRAFAIPLQ